eukprot:10203230-Alexandrium_andersonii.AAC.1
MSASLVGSEMCIRDSWSPTLSDARDWSAKRMARRESSGLPPGRVTISQRAGPAGPMIANRRGAGSVGRGPCAR